MSGPEIGLPGASTPEADTSGASTPEASTEARWPRWEVLKQDAPGRPHQAVGSVHATDPQHALFTARSVFARRPAAVSLWVVPESQIHSLTREELEAGHTLPDAAHPVCTYRVFAKKTHKRSMTFMDELGSALAVSPQAALEAARAQFGESLLAWWIIPESAFVASPDAPGDIESWFTPAADKTYKQQSSYGVIGQHASARNPRAKERGRD